MREEQLHNILTDIFGEEYETKGNQFRVNCISPDCEDVTGNLEISLIKGAFHCWKCGYKGTVLKLFKDYLGWVPKIEEKYINLSDYKDFTKIDEVKIEKEIKVAEYPEYFVPFKNDSNLGYVGKKALNYILTRMSMDEVLKYRIGYCGLGKYKWRIIVPFFENDKMIYFVSRSFMGIKPVYKNPKVEEIGIGKESIIFNIDRASKHKRVVICEGVFDAIRIGDDGIAILGTELHDSQLYKLISYGIRIFDILLDEDAIKSAVKMAEKIKMCGIRDAKIKVVKLSSGDPSDWDNNFIRNKIESTPFYVDEISLSC